MTHPARHRFPRRGTAWIALVVLLGTALWLGLSEPRREQPRARAADRVREDWANTAPRPAARRATPEPPTVPAAQTPDSGDHAEDRHPHPLTPEHEKIQHENRLIQALNDAVDLGNAARIREVVEIYRKVHGVDEHDLQEGYERIADCLEFPGPASRAEAQRYYDEKRASTLRRFVRRHCLERIPP